MPIDEGIDTDLRFLILEVRKQLDSVRAHLKQPTSAKLKRITVKDDYVDQLKDAIENKCNTFIYVNQRKQPVYFQALISIATSLERIADYLVQIAKQTAYIKEDKAFSEFELKEFFLMVEQALDLVQPAFAKTSVGQAKKICEFEEVLDALYLEMFEELMLNINEGYQVEDMVTVLFVIRYFERMGNEFLKIGEAIINVNVGEKMRLRSFKTLEKGMKKLDINLFSDNFEYCPILNTRSGCKLAHLSYVDESSGKQCDVFYKEGQKKKLQEEIEGTKLYEKTFPGSVPKLLWNSKDSEYSTVLFEWIHGQDLLNLTLQKNKEYNLSHSKAVKILLGHLGNIWSQTKIKVNKQEDLNYVEQILTRKRDITSVHKKLLKKASEEDFSEILTKAKKIESRLKKPFSVLIHGDFNVDNVVFDLNSNRPYFVDLHRAHLGDYAQDVSVFLVSNFRVPIFNKAVRKKLNQTNQKMFVFAREFSQKHKDKTFEARLALGLFRSFITSTRFQFDVEFSEMMFTRGLEVIRSLIKHKGKMEKFRLLEDVFLY